MRGPKEPEASVAEALPQIAEEVRLLRATGATAVFAVFTFPFGRVGRHDRRQGHVRFADMVCLSYDSPSVFGRRLRPRRRQRTDQQQRCDERARRHRYSWRRTATADKTGRQW
jgi:hypothetical protein